MVSHFVYEGGALVGSALLKSLAYKAAAVQETDLSMSYIEHSKFVPHIKFLCTQQTQNICITFVQRRSNRRRSNILQMLYKCFVFAG